ncbi:MAG: hypothetical protein ABI910_02080 [Gemmatimonadota bacterium]
MMTTERAEPVHITTVDVDGRRFNVTVAIEHDGVEHLGHLWFADEAWDDEGVRDHGSIPGQSPDDVLAHARLLSESDLALRYERAQAEKRRFHGLRRVTDDVLSHIRYLNKVATSMRAGLLDVEEAAAEIDETEQRLHAIVGQLRNFAGVIA